jgi:protein CpxP
MSRLSSFRIAAVLVAATLSLPAAAFAQSTSTAAPPAAAAATGSPALPADVAAKVEPHIKELHDQLGITPAEQPQWEQFADVMRTNAAQMNEAFTNRAAKVASMNAADTMQSYAQIAQVHAGNMEKLASAFQSLYNSFPDPQKQVADTVFHNTSAKPPQHKH